MKSLSRSFFIVLGALSVLSVSGQYGISSAMAETKVSPAKPTTLKTNTKKKTTTTTTSKSAPKQVQVKSRAGDVKTPQKLIPGSVGNMPSIISVRTGMNATKTRIVIETDRPVTFRAFTLGNPYRVIVDVPNSNWKTAQNKLLTADLLKGYRSGALDNGLMRLAFDLRKPAVIDAAFILPAKGDSRDRVVIDLAPSTENLFNAREKQVAGDNDILDTKNTIVPPPKDLARQMLPIKAARDNNVSTIEPEDASAAVVETTTVTETVSGTAPTLPTRKPASFGQTVEVTETKTVKRIQPGDTPQRAEMQAPKQQVVAAKKNKKSKYTVVIDAGHGGEDPGALGVGNIYEKNITLSVAQELRRQLEETGRYKVVMTRDRDIYIPLRERVNISREKGGDVFISIHADKVDRAVTRGASIYTLSLNASDNETARLAEQENNSGVVAGVDLSEESHDVAGILLDLSMREKMNESNLLAGYLREGLSRESIRLLPNSHRSAGFAVLKAPDVPAVLIETGFLSNPEEVKLLNSGSFQRKLAGSIVDGIDAFFAKIEALQGL